MGDDETAPIADPPASGQWRSQLVAAGITRDHTWSTDAGTTDRRPFKRRAAPAPVSGQTGTGQNARAAKRLRRSANQASKRGGGGLDRGRDTSGVNAGAVSKQQFPSTSADECSAEHEHEPEYDNDGDQQPDDADEGGSGRAIEADSDAEGDEGAMLW